MSSNWVEISNIPTLTDNYMNRKVALWTAFDVEQLAKWISDPSLFESFFSTPANWLSSLQLYPFLAFKDNELEFGKLWIGGRSRDVPNKVSASYIDVTRCYYYLGQCYIRNNFHNFMDYNGYTKIELFLPYYGTLELNPNDVVGKFIQFRMKVDFNTGDAVYIIGVTDESLNYDYRTRVITETENLDHDMRILSTKMFHVAVDIPLNYTNAGEVKRNAIMGAIKIAGSFAATTAIGAAGLALTTSTSTEHTTTRTVENDHRKKSGSTVTQDSKRNVSYNSLNRYKAENIENVFAYSTDALNNMKPSANTDSPNNALLYDCLSQNIKVIVYRPKTKLLNAEYNKLYGKPLGEVKRLNTLTGFTQISKIHIEGSAFGSAISEEMAILEKELTDGIIL